MGRLGFSRIDGLLIQSAKASGIPVSVDDADTVPDLTWWLEHQDSAARPVESAPVPPTEPALSDVYSAESGDLPTMRSLYNDSTAVYCGLEPTEFIPTRYTAA